MDGDKKPVKPDNFRGRACLKLASAPTNLPPEKRPRPMNIEEVKWLLGGKKPKLIFEGP